MTPDPGQIASAVLQIATTATSPPEARTSRSVSPGPLVRIVAFCLRAVVTTTASTTSDVLVMPSSRPASCASVSPRGTTAHPVKKRRSWACCGDRLTWATTGAGTNLEEELKKIRELIFAERPRADARESPLPEASEPVREQVVEPPPEPAIPIFSTVLPPSLLRCRL